MASYILMITYTKSTIQQNKERSPYIGSHKKVEHQAIDLVDPFIINGPQLTTVYSKLYINILCPLNLSNHS